MLESAAFYELPSIRDALLPAAWSWAQQQLKQSADTLTGRTRARLQFLIRSIQETAIESAEDPTTRMWSRLLGNPSSGERCHLCSTVWHSIANLCSALASLPGQWFRAHQLHWLLPNVLVLTQLSQSGLAGEASPNEQRHALAAMLTLSSILIRSQPTEVLVQEANLWPAIHPGFLFLSARHFEHLLPLRFGMLVDLISSGGKRTR